MRSLFTAVLAVSFLAGCGVETTADPELPDADERAAQAQGLACPPVSNTNINRSLVVTNPEVLAKFSFQRTMQQLLTKAGSTQTPLALYRQWMTTLRSGVPGGCDSDAIDPNGYGLVCPRAPEAQLANLDPFSGAPAFVPIALFNRFDLAASDGSTCGEYRIVYAMRPGALPGRGFFIFEAALPNPNPAAGQAGCLPIARFWQRLTADADVNSRAAKLEKFYYLGTAVSGVPAVVDAKHLGTGTGKGQVRTNLFINNLEWALREFKLRTTCAKAVCTLTMQHVTVKANAANELFSGAHERSPEWRSAFVARLPSLLATNVNGIALSVPNQFNEFESVSQRTDVVYRNFTSNGFRGQIQTRLNELGSTLTVDNVLDRATTQTCGGCHRQSALRNLGGGLTWPLDRTFVHVDERSVLSDALTGTFLPHRKTVLETFINAHCTGLSLTVKPGFTLGGSADDAPN